MSYTRRTMPRLLMRVWDLPTRLFVWAAALLLASAATGAWMSWTRLHVLSGYALLTLLLFRVAWGFVGSETARFGYLLRGPADVGRQLASFRAREPDNGIGHGAAGGWLLLATLALLAVLIGTGLFSADGSLAGPLAGRVSPEAGGRLAAWHRLSFAFLLGALALQFAAVAATALIRRQDPVRPLLTGKKRLPANLRQPRFASPFLAAAVFAASAGLVWVLVSLA